MKFGCVDTKELFVQREIASRCSEEMKIDWKKNWMNCEVVKSMPLAPKNIWKKKKFKIQMNS